MCCEVQLFSHDQKTYVEMCEDDSRGEREDEVGVAVCEIEAKTLCQMVPGLCIPQIICRQLKSSVVDGSQFQSMQDPLAGWGSVPLAYQLVSLRLALLFSTRSR